MFRQLFIFGVILGSLVGPTGGLWAQDIVVSQRELGPMACGTCAIYHSLASGGAEF